MIKCQFVIFVSASPRIDNVKRVSAMSATNAQTATIVILVKANKKHLFWINSQLTGCDEKK